MTLAHACSTFAPAYVCVHADLLPSAALAFLIWIASSAHPFFFLFTVAGTLSHELVSASKR
jgi:hypothetical protein